MLLEPYLTLIGHLDLAYFIIFSTNAVGGIKYRM